MAILPPPSNRALQTWVRAPSPRAGWRACWNDQDGLQKTVWTPSWNFRYLSRCFEVSVWQGTFAKVKVPRGIGWIAMKRHKYSGWSGLLLCYIVDFPGGCSNMFLFNPKGSIGAAEWFLLFVAIGLMLLTVIRVFVMTHWFPRK